MPETVSFSNSKSQFNKMETREQKANKQEKTKTRLNDKDTRRDEKERKTKLPITSEESDYDKREANRRLEREEREMRNLELMEYYRAYQSHAMPFRCNKPFCPYIQSRYSYNGFDHQYLGGPNFREPEEGSDNSEDESSNSRSPTCSSSEKMRNLKQKRGIIHQMSSSSNEPQIDPKKFDIKLPHQVGHHNFHMPSDSRQYQSQTHHPWPYPLPHPGPQFGWPEFPHPYSPTPIHSYPYGYPMPFYPAYPMRSPYGYPMDRFPPMHYPGHLFSPHHADIATPDRRYYDNKSSTKKSNDGKDNKSKKRYSDKTEDVKIPEIDKLAQAKAVEDQKKEEQKRLLHQSFKEFGVNDDSKKKDDLFKS